MTGYQSRAVKEQATASVPEGQRQVLLERILHLLFIVNMPLRRFDPRSSCQIFIIFMKLTHLHCQRHASRLAMKAPHPTGWTISRGEGT